MAMLKVKAGRENWVKDTDVADCRMCMVKFGVLTRKHHCRACGDIFCSSCCGTEISYTPSTRKDEKGYTEKKKRVCKACFKSIHDGSRCTTEAKFIAGAPAKGGVDSGNMAATGNSFKGNPFIATSFDGKSFRLAFEKTNALATSRPEPTHVFPSLNPLNWAESCLERKPAERRFSFDQADSNAAFLIMQQEEKRRALSGEAEPEQEPTGGSAPGAQQHGAAGEGDRELDPGRADEEESAAAYYIEKLQAQKRLLEARLCEQGQEEADGGADPSQVPLETEAAILDKQFEELVQKSNLYDQAEAGVPEGGKQPPSATDTGRAELLKLSLAVLKLSLKYEYRKKQAPGARGPARPAGKVRDLTLRD